MDDLIDRQAAIDGKILIELANGVEIYPAEAVLVEYLRALPSAQPERKVGHWKLPSADGCITYDKKAYAECSVCGEKEFLGWNKNYCPNCGAYNAD